MLNWWETLAWRARLGLAAAAASVLLFLAAAGWWVLRGDPARWETLEIDSDATAHERDRLRALRTRDEGHRQAQAALGWWVGARLDGA